MGGPQSIPLSRIRPNPSPVREPKIDRHFVDDIRDRGIVQAITVRPAPDSDGFQVVAGMRRYLAALRLSLKEVPCLVLDLDDRGAFFAAVSENLLREEMGASDVAQAVLHATEELKMQPEEVAKEFKRSVKEIRGWLSLSRNQKAMNHLREHPVPYGIALSLQRGWDEVEELKASGLVESDQGLRFQIDFLNQSHRRPQRDYDRFITTTLEPFRGRKPRQTGLGEADTENTPHEIAIEMLAARFSQYGRIERSVRQPDLIVRLTSPEAKRKYGCEALWVEVDDTHPTSVKKLHEIQSLLGSDWRILIRHVRTNTEELIPEISPSERKQQRTL